MKPLMPVTTLPSLRSLRKEMDRLFDRFWDWDLEEFPSLGEWRPMLDLSETKEAFTVRVEVPGIDPKDIQVSLHDEYLTIKGEKRQETELKDEHLYRAERSYGSFSRGMRLPAPVDASNVNATFKHGVLTVTLPKIAETKGTVIPVKAG